MRKFWFIIFIVVCLLRCSVSIVGTEVVARQYSFEPYARWEALPTDTLMNRARAYVQQREYRDSALLCNTIVANRYYDHRQSDAEREQSVFAMNNIGYLYFSYYYDYQMAYSWLQKALSLAEKHHIDKARGYVLNNLGSLMTLMETINDADTHQLALDYYKQAWQIFLGIKDWDLAMIIANNINDLTEGNLAILDSLQHDIRSHKFPANTQMLPYFEWSVQLAHAMHDKRYPLALALCDSVEKRIDVTYNPERFLLINYSKRAQIYSLMGDYDKSIYWIDQTKQLADQYGVRETDVEIEKNYYQYYLKKGDQAAAQKHQLLYFQKKDSLLHQAKLLKASELHFLNELQKINVEAEQSARHARLWVWVVLALLVVLIVIGALLAFLRRKNRELEGNYRLLYQRAQQTMQMEQSLQKYRHSKLDDDMKDDLASKIVEVMEQTDVICQDDFDRDKLASLVNTTPASISQVLTERFNMNFSQLLSEYRIKEACRRINDQQHYGDMTIEAIAASVGFKSRSNFATNFKRVTGLTPSQYLKQSAMS